MSCSLTRTLYADQLLITAAAGINCTQESFLLFIAVCCVLDTASELAARILAQMPCRYKSLSYSRRTERLRLGVNHCQFCLWCWVAQSPAHRHCILVGKHMYQQQARWAASASSQVTGLSRTQVKAKRIVHRIRILAINPLWPASLLIPCPSTVD